MPGSADGAVRRRRFNRPYGLCVDCGGNLCVADKDNSTIRKISPTGQVTTIAGTYGSPGGADGVGATATFTAPENIALRKHARARRRQ